MAKTRKKTARSKPTKKPARPASFNFLNGSHATVRSHLKAAVDLPTFLASVAVHSFSSIKIGLRWCVAPLGATGSNASVLFCCVIENDTPSQPKTKS